MAKVALSEHLLEEILVAIVDAESVPSAALRKKLAELSGKLEGSIDQRLNELSGNDIHDVLPGPTMG